MQNTTKTWVIIISSAVLLILLGIRGIYLRVHRVEDEKDWYVKELNIRATVQIDTLEMISKNVGFIVCHAINGKIDKGKELSLNKKLKYYKRIQFLRYRPGGQVDIFSRRIDQYQVGDSIQINSAKDEILFFRKGDSLWQAKVSNSLRERVF
ncbi:hypothetical protein WSM22_14860 [Cytophagales bacterium WSM2-2]|nr:hypothetical protein WSM22_14860 [Cytophagales bacterium WSM2-2]